MGLIRASPAQYQRTLGRALHWCHPSFHLDVSQTFQIYIVKKELLIFLSCSPTQASSTAVNGMTTTSPSSQTEDLGVPLEPSLLSFTICSPPANPVGLPTTPTQSTYLPSPLSPLQLFPPASALVPNNPPTRMIFPKRELEHASPLFKT